MGDKDEPNEKEEHSYSKAGRAFFFDNLYLCDLDSFPRDSPLCCNAGVSRVPAATLRNDDISRIEQIPGQRCAFPWGHGYQADAAAYVLNNPIAPGMIL